jgi:type II secretory pathway component PulK
MNSMLRAQAANRQRGLALVIVIWILTLLSLMAGSFALSMRRESSVAGALKNNAQAQALAETGLSIAQFMLQQTDPDSAGTRMAASIGYRATTAKFVSGFSPNPAKSISTPPRNPC